MREVIRHQEDLMYAVFRNLEKGMSLKDSVTDAYKRYGDEDYFPLISYSLTASKYQIEMLKLKIQKGKGFCVIGLSRNEYENIKARRTGKE